MGPQHPSTHGVLRLVLTLEGETVTDARASIGYLHTGIEKNMEYRTWTQGTTFITRADYLMPLFNEAAYCMAIERLLGIEDKLPERATLIRVLMLELNRIGSHLGGIGPFGLELGATTIFLQGVRMRENVLDLFELITGLRMNHAFIRPGGVAQDLPAGGIEAIRDFLRKAPAWVDDLRTLIDANPVFKARTAGHRLPGPRGLHGPRRDRADASRHRAALGPAQVPAVPGLRDLRVRRPDSGHLRHLRSLPGPDGRDRRVAADHRAGPRPARRPGGRRRTTRG